MTRMEMSFRVKFKSSNSASDIFVRVHSTQSIYRWHWLSVCHHMSSHWGILPPPTCPQQVTERPLYFTLSVCAVCLCVCYQTRGAPKGQHAALSRSRPSLFPPQETQITQFVCNLCFKASPLVNRYSWNFFRGGLHSEPEQRRGEADSANGYKDKWKNVDAWESHRQWKRMKERVHHLDRSLTMGGHN